MRTQKRNETTMETRRGPGSRRRRRRVLSRPCASCGADRHLLTIEYASCLSGLSLRQLFRHVEGGQLHFVEAPDGSFICLDSLCALVSRTKELAPHFPG